MGAFDLATLERSVIARAGADPSQSWTARLAAAGLPKACEKLGEEAVETIVAALAEDEDAFRGEVADLLYHLLVVMHLRGVTLAEILAVLEARTARSGVAEKAARQKATDT